MTQVVVRVMGARQAMANLEGMGLLAGNMRGPLRDLDDLIRHGAEAAFAAQGPGWAPLSAMTIEDRLRRGFGAGPILTRSGRLRRSYTEAGGEHMVDVTDDSLDVGSSVEYARFHQSGTRSMPARPVEMDARTRQLIEQRLADALADRGNGGL